MMMVNDEVIYLSACRAPTILGGNHGVALFNGDSIFTHKGRLDGSLGVRRVICARVGAAISAWTPVARDLRACAAIAVAVNRGDAIMGTLEFRHILIISWTALDILSPRSAPHGRL